MEKLRVIIFHSEVPPDAPPDEQDVLQQADFVSQGLRTAGFETFSLPFVFAIPENIAKIREIKPALIFNLVETIQGSGSLIHLAPAVFEHLKIPFTGCGAEATYVTSNKIIAKKLFRFHGIPTPPWIDSGNIDDIEIENGEQFLIKSLMEHASAGMDEKEVVLLSEKEKIREILQKNQRNGTPVFAEQYIGGREFNISMLGGATLPLVLPVAEIRFTDFPEDKLKIVGYRSKWDESSFEFQHTVRTFDTRDKNEPLHQKLSKICLLCWKAFRLKGYVRVDFRVDENGNPWVLEINTNPCIAPDSGFVAATQKAGINFEEVLSRIISDAINTKN